MTRNPPFPVQPRVRRNLRSCACSVSAMELPSLSHGHRIRNLPCTGPHCQKLPTLALVLLVWITGGVLSLFGSLSIGELAANYPGRAVSTFTCGTFMESFGIPLRMALLSLIQSGSIATLASGFALYTSKIVTLTPFEFKALPIVAILFFSIVNLVGIRIARAVQNIGAISKLIGIALVFGLLIARGHTSLLRIAMPAHPSPSLLVDFGVALIAVLWAYEGWHVVSFTAGEFKSPAHDLPRSLFWGTLIVTVIYLFLNVAYYAVLTPLEVSGSASAQAARLKRPGARERCCSSPSSSSPRSSAP